MRTYECLGNNRRKYILAFTPQHAREECQRRFGFWPETVEETAI